MRTALLVLVVSMTLGASAPTAGSALGPQAIRLIWVQTSNHPNGSRASWRSQLLNATQQFGRPAGAKVGAEVGISHGAQFVGGIKLPGGVLTYSGKVRHLPHHGGIVVPIVEGSGAFEGATGTYTRSEGGSSTTVVIRLQSAAEKKGHSRGPSN
ncbi:MAG: hypothetical protein ACTHKS_06690 [Gaiellaceae bacterium]